MGRPKKLKGFDSIKDNEILMANGVLTNIGKIFQEKDFQVAKNGELFVLHDSLRKAVRLQIGKVVSYIPMVAQSPTKSNEWCSVVTIRYSIKEHNNDCYLNYGATADCRVGNATGYKNYTTAIAETRASARALRNILGLSICSKEEVEDIDDIVGKSMDDTAESVQIMLIEKKILGEKKWPIEKLSGIIGRDIIDLKDLTKSEAAQIIGEFNSSK